MYDTEKLARALSPGARAVATEADMRRDRAERIKQETRYKNGDMTNKERWEFLRELGVDPTKAYAEDFTNHQRRAEQLRASGLQGDE
jgi:hypothetical protein